MAPISSGDDGIETGTVSNPDRSPPKSVQRELDRRRKTWLGWTKRRAAFDEALAYTEEERKEVDDAFHDIADELGILAEAEDLQKVFRAPRERYLELLDENAGGKKGRK